MKLRTFLLLTSLAAPVALTGCGDSDSAEATPSEITSASGDFTLTVDVDTWTPTVGESTVRLMLADADGPAHAESLTVVPWMTVHDHGSSKETVAEHEAHGTWLVKQVVYTMPGAWVLNVTAVIDGEEETFVVPANVE